jgi:parvulin-like peptidyl-prolyl isomerase
MVARVIMFTLLFCGLAANCPFAEEINPVIGKVGDFTIRETDLDRLIAGQPPEGQKQLQERPELKVGIVQELLMKNAVARLARKEGFDKKPEFREKLSYVIDDFISREYMTSLVVSGVKVSEEELKKFYGEKGRDLQVPETARLRHIFIKVASDAAEEERRKGRARAEELLQRLKKGEDFVKLAAETSEDGDTAKKGGELGTISPGKTNSAAFEKSVFALKGGELGIIETQYGLHVVRVDERSESRQATLEEARPYISARLQKELEQKKLQEFLDKTARESGMEVYAERIAGAVKEEGKKPEK